MIWKRFIPLLVLFGGFSAAYFSGFSHLFTFENFSRLNEKGKVLVEGHPVAAPLVFMGIYYLYAALALPGAFVLTIISGCLFPLPLSTFYVVLADTAGACTLFLSAQAAFGEGLPKKAGPFLEKMEAGFNKNAIQYMLMMRLIPIFPFWIVNVAPAFFGIRLLPFLATTIIGLIPENLILTASASFLVSYMNLSQ